MTDCIFEPGKEYTTRDGRRARVYAVDGVAPYVVHGATYNRDMCAWEDDIWMADGKYHEGRGERPRDLLPLKCVMWVNVYEEQPTGALFVRGYPSHLCALNARHANAPCIARVRVEFTPGQFDEEPHNETD